MIFFLRNFIFIQLLWEFSFVRFSLTNARPQLKRLSTDAFDDLLTMCHVLFIFFCFAFVRRVAVCLNPALYFDQICSTVQPLLQSHFCSSLNNVWIGPCALTFKHGSFALLAIFLILRDKIQHDRVKRCEQDQKLDSNLHCLHFWQNVAYLMISLWLTLYNTQQKHKPGLLYWCPHTLSLQENLSQHKYTTSVWRAGSAVKSK